VIAPGRARPAAVSRPFRIFRFSFLVFRCNRQRYDPRVKRKPLLVLLLACALLTLLPFFVSDATWSSGLGDVVILAMAIVYLALIVWERRLLNHDTQRRP